MWAAALIDDLDMRDDEADAETAAASACDGGVPASIVELYTPTWDETCCRSRAAEDHGSCAVCLEGLEMGQEFRMMPCSHTFHQLCIFKWLVVNRLCPFCQFALPSSEDDDQDMLEEDYAAAAKRYYTPKFINFIMNF